jgi:hypothetical protein
MPDVPATSLAAAEAAIIKAASDFGHDDMVCGSSRALARAALEAAAPLLAEAWNLPSLQAEHDEWQRRGEKARRIQDEFFRKIDARHAPAGGSPEVPGEH